MITKKLWKRMIAMALIIVMAIVMAACGKGKEENSGDSIVPGDETKVEAQDPFGAYAETLQVEIGRPIEPGKVGPDGGSHEENAIRTHIKDTLNVEYTYVIEAANSTDYGQQLSLAIAGEELPDIFTIYDRNTLDELVENELVADLTEIYEDYASDDLKAMYDAYNYSVLDRATYGGKLMALPRCSPELESLVWIRQDWVEALGVTVDEDGNNLITREELEELARKFIEADPGESGNPVGFSIIPNITEDADASISVVNNSFGAFNRKWLQGEDGSIYSGSTLPEAKDALAWWADMFQKGILDPQYGTRTWDDIIELMVNGQLGIVFGEMSCPAWMFTNVYAANPDARFNAYALDTGEGYAVTPYYNSVNRWVVARKDYEHPELVLKFANIIRDITGNPNLAEENSVLYEYVVAGTVIDYFDPVTMANYPADDWTSRYIGVRDYLNGDIMREDISNPRILADIDAVERYQKDPAALSPEELGNYEWCMKGIKTVVELNEQELIRYVSPLYLGNTETMNSKKADLDKLEEETYIKIITGELSVDGFDSFVEEWMEIGGAKIAEELAEKVR